MKGLNAVDSAKHTTNIFRTLSHRTRACALATAPWSRPTTSARSWSSTPPCIANLRRSRSTRSWGSPAKDWSSGGDPSCLYDSANGGHWFFTEIVSASPESKGGAFAGCFAAVANDCYEGIAVTDGSSPFGPYHVYFLNANYNPAEPGYPYLLNDFAKISVTRDAFLMFYDEFPLAGSVPGFGGGFFNGAQEFAFNKSALEHGLPVTLKNGKPNPGHGGEGEHGPDPHPGWDLRPRQGAARGRDHLLGGGDPGAAGGRGQYDNSHGGTGFMLGSLDFYGFAPCRRPPVTTGSRLGPGPGCPP